MKLTFKLPLPDHYPAAAFEFLTGYGFIERVDPVLNQVIYSLEAETLGELVRTVDEVASEVNCYEWWNDKVDFFAQAQEQIDAQKLGHIEINLAQVRSLTTFLKRVQRSRTVTPSGPENALTTEVLALLEKFQPLVVEETR